MQILNSAKEIMKKLNEHGYEAYLVGGCVRDMLLNIEPKDYDITTNALPDTVEGIFPKTIPTGKDYGTISVMVEGEGYEVTTYRLESEYTDGRRPRAVQYSDSLKEDLARRDFTVNALAMDIEDNVIDYYNGRNDLEQRVIKCVGNPYERFGEDKLRKLRAVRFASQKSFAIDKETSVSIKENPCLVGVSYERIREELNKILLSEKPSIGIRALCDMDLMKNAMPELVPCIGFKQNSPFHDKDVFEHILSAVDQVEPKLELRLAALFHDISKPLTYSEGEDGVGHFYGHGKSSSRMAVEIMTRLKYSNKEIKHVSELVYQHMTKPKLSKKSVRRFMSKIEGQLLPDLLKLMVADTIASKPPFFEDLSYIYELKSMCNEILEEKQPLSVKDLYINGRDVLDAFPILLGQEKLIGGLMNHLLDLVIDEPELNQRKELLDSAKSYLDDLLRPNSDEPSNCAKTYSSKIKAEDVHTATA